MIWSIPALQDATIYESDPYRNTGLDSILELTKQGDVSSNDFTESRILIKFDLTELSASLSENNVTINDVTANLRLYTVRESNLPKSYTIEAKMVSENWENGTGYFHFPSTEVTGRSVTDGATWKTIAGSGSLSWTLATTPGTAASFVSESGGGRWHTSSIASQSFSFKINDQVNINVTNAVKSWFNGSIPNYGFVLSYKTSEITASNYPTANIQFYSAESTTVFEPQLFIQWTGSLVYNTGSQAVAVYENSPIIYLRNFNGEYLKNKKHRVFLSTRDKHPRPTFTQTSAFANTNALTSASYYQIKDAHNDQIIIPYSDFTKISTNSSGSYFDFYTTMLYSERYYKFEFKVHFADVTEYFDSNEFIFKVVN